MKFSEKYCFVLLQVIMLTFGSMLLKISFAPIFPCEIWVQVNFQHTVLHSDAMAH